jgi:hypothetical protein
VVDEGCMEVQALGWLSPQNWLQQWGE